MADGIVKKLSEFYLLRMPMVQIVLMWFEFKSFQ
jgi:hypothetical protein